MRRNGPTKRSRKTSRPLLTVLAVAVAVAFLALWMSSHARPVEGNQSTQAATPDPLHGDIYPDGARAPRDLANALAQAGRQHKRVILDFGGNWCGDCRVLDIYFHDASNLPLLQANYVLVHVNVGQYDENLDLAAKYGVPLQKGVPALVVLSPDGRVLFSQRNGEFEAMRRMDSSSVTEFLNKWKG